MKVKIHIAAVFALLVAAFILLVLAFTTRSSVGQEKDQGAVKTEQAQPSAQSAEKQADKDKSAESDPAENGPGEDYVIEEIKKKREKVPFNHFKHASTQKGYKIPCKDCHHTSKDTEVDSGCTGANCHGDTKVGKRLALKGAYHKNCIECHLKNNKAKKTDTAPRKCNGCHK